MNNNPTMLITGTSKGIGKYLVKYYSDQGYSIVGCARSAVDYECANYQHFCLDVSDESAVMRMFAEIRKTHGRLDVLINNAGIASMNHLLLTPIRSVHNIFNTNVVAAFLFCREAVKVMQIRKYGRIVNFATVATPLKLEGESVYAASKAAVVSFTEVLAREAAPYNITINAVGPTPIKTDLIKSVPPEKLDALIRRQAIPRFGEFQDVSNVIDFFIRPESDFITGQVIYLGGV
jgi:3-oxoacyl-[acyl-carrier protein] reductase